MLNYLFLALSFIYVFSAIMVIFSHNPIQSVLYLILVFLVNVCFFISLGVDFLALIFMIIYIGAIAVLFLFVVMMLNIKTVELNESFFKYLPISLFLLIIFLFEINYLININFFRNLHLDYKSIIEQNNWIFFLNSENSLYLFSFTLYTHFFFAFFLSSLILLLAMIGSITLTLNYIKISKKEDVFFQLTQDLQKSLRLIKINK